MMIFEEDQQLAEIFARLSQPGVFRPISSPTRLGVLREVKVVFFDVYGTLFLGTRHFSQSPREHEPLVALERALEAVGLPPSDLGKLDWSVFCGLVADAQQKRREEGVEYPEIDIVEVWKKYVGLLEEADIIRRVPCSRQDQSHFWHRLVVEFEARVNPVWPSPGVLDALSRLRSKGLRLGIISNAQFYVRLLFPAFLRSSLEELGFSPELLFFSYEHGCAKPGTGLYERARTKVATLGFDPSEVLHVGNDVRHDMVPAHSVGFRTALLAIDEHNVSFLPEDSPDPIGPADLVVRSFDELLRCLSA